MLEDDVNLQEDQNGGRRRRKKKKKKEKVKEVSESDWCLLEINSSSSLKLEQLNEDLAGATETPVGEKIDGRKKKKHKEKTVSYVAETTAKVQPSGSLAAEEGGQRKGKRKRQRQEDEEGGFSEVVEMTGELVRKRDKRTKRSVEGDVVENALEARDSALAEGRAMVMRGQHSKMEQEGVPVDTKRKKKKKKSSDVEENSPVERSRMKSAEHLGESGREHKRTKDLEAVDEEGMISSSQHIVQDADAQRCIEQLKEFVPNVEKKSPTVLHHMIKYDLSRFKQLKEEGKSFKRGRFSAEENERLIQNIRDFLVLTGISSGDKLFFTARYPDEMAEIRRMKILHKFHSQIAVGIFRPWHEIYSRGRKVFDDLNYKGRYTEDELKKLHKLQNLHGNNWMKISELTGRSSMSLEKRFSQNVHQKGEWTEAELKKLMRILKDYMVTQVESGDGPPERVIRKEKLYSNVPWKRVSECMETRNWVQCRVKWMAILKRKMTSGADVYKGKKSLQAKIRLIRALYEMDVEDAADVNWEALTFTIGNVPPAYVQAKFYKLKVTQVPQWQSMSFADIIDFLYTEVVPKLEKQLRDCENESVLPKEIFHLSDIFDVDEEQGATQMERE